MSQILQTPQIPNNKFFVEILGIKRAYNVEVTPKLVMDILLGKYNIRDKEIVKGDEILGYCYETWGSCREIKIVVLESGNYVDGRWINNSSNRNAMKYKLTPIEDIAGKELEVYVRYSPSCNPSKKFSFRAIIKITR